MLLAIKQNIHYLLYALANSAAMNGVQLHHPHHQRDDLVAYDLPRVHLRLCSPHRTVRPAVRRVCGQEQEAEDCKGA